MSDWLMRVIKAEAERLIELAAEDDELRADLRALAESILAATDGQPVNRSIETTPATSPSEAVTAVTQQAEEPLSELTLGSARRRRRDPALVTQALNEHKRQQSTISPTSKPAAGGKARRLAGRPNACGGLVRGTSSRSRTRRSTRRWSNGPTGSSIASTGCSRRQARRQPISRCSTMWAGASKRSPRHWHWFGSCWTSTRGTRRFWSGRCHLSPKRNPALRAAFQRLGAAADPDQLEVFEWLKVTAARHHVYIKRFMRADEVADPAGWYDLLGPHRVRGSDGKQYRLPVSQVERIRDRLKHVQTDVSCDDDDWLALINVVDEIVGEGVPPSNREIRELLLPVIDELPARDEIPAGFRLVLREIDRFLAARSAPIESSVAHEPSAEVKEAARLLGGKSIVLIGGNRRREAQESLRRALGLKDLIWIETKEHQAVDAFEPLIARRDVALVLLAIRWSSHAFGDVKQICDRHGKLLVRLPGGYNPNQVAAQILSQSSTQLSSDLGPAGTSRTPAARSASSVWTSLTTAFQSSFSPVQKTSLRSGRAG